MLAIRLFVLTAFIASSLVLGQNATSQTLDCSHLCAVTTAHGTKCENNTADHTCACTDSTYQTAFLGCVRQGCSAADYNLTLSLNTAVCSAFTTASNGTTNNTTTEGDALSNGYFPTCSNGCLTSALTTSNSSCTLTDPVCLCQDSNWLSAFYTCSQAACPPNAYAIVLSIENKTCSAFAGLMINSTSTSTLRNTGVPRQSVMSVAGAFSAIAFSLVLVDALLF